MALPVAAQSSVPATSVPLILPTAVAYDATGNLYVAETGGHVIRKVDAAGGITTVAGDGVQGYSGDGGPAVAAQLDSPQGVALDGAGHLCIADTHNHVIRRVDLSSGVIRTIAGSGSSGFDGDGGPAVGAHLNLPAAIAFDAAGNLYLADSGNHRIRRVDAVTGIITTVAGNGVQGYSGDGGSAVNAALDSPNGLALDGANNLYLADTHNQRIRRVDAATGGIATVAGSGVFGYSGDNVTAGSASIALPHGLTIDAAGNLYFADTGNRRIRRVDAATGVITTVAGTGTQGFSGDGGAAVSATLDTPRGMTLSTAGLLTLADTGNQRVRQLDGAAGSATVIQTVAGVGATSPGTLSIVASSVIVYGTGSLTAELASGTPATGTVTFLDTTGAGTRTLGSVSLVSNRATLPTGSLAAGLHSIVATYAGDQTHLSAESSAFALSVAPQQLTATIQPVALLYGQAIPVLTGTLSGLLPQDAASVTASFATTAGNLSPVGVYPLTASIAGPAAGNYTLVTSPATLTITPAPTLTTLSVGTVTVGSPVQISAHVASTTSGTPTGTVALLSNGSSLFTSAVSATGDAGFTITSPAAGSYTLTARYSGDGNFSPSASSASQFTVGTGSTGTGSDFSLTATGNTSQTILSGASATYNFSIQTQGSISSAITLAASGLPGLSTASFNPAYITPGSSNNSFTLTIATPKTSARLGRASSIAWTALLLPFACVTLRSRRYRFFRGLGLLSLICAVCAGCGDRVNSANSGGGQNPVQTFTITVTGTATTAGGTTLQHTAVVTLNLQGAS